MSYKSNSLKTLKIVLTTLITSLAITGFGYLDNKIWNIIMFVIGMIAYSIVGILFSFGLIHGKDAGKKAYALVFIILLILGYCLYRGIVAFQKWLLSWPLAVKIIIPCCLTFLIICVSILLIVKSKKIRK